MDGSWGATSWLRKMGEGCADCLPQGKSFGTSAGAYSFLLGPAASTAARAVGLAALWGAHTFLSVAKEKCAKESQRHGDSCGPRRPAPAQAAWGIGKPCKIGCVYAAGIFLPRQRPAWFQIHAGLFMRAMRPVAEWRSVLSNQQGSCTRPASRGTFRATAVKPRSSGMSPYTPARHRRAEAGAGL